MNRKEIMSEWTLKEKNKQASVELWDSMAESFHEKETPTFEENSFLQLLQSQNMIGPNVRVLDVGCGTGSYSRALASRCEHVTGVDLSSKMIELAAQRAEQEQIKNLEFRCVDWHQTDLKMAGFENRFDLVIAHMTPAVQSAETFLKLSQASKAWCVLSKPTRRTDPVSDEVKKLAGITEKRESGERDIIFAFELLMFQGLMPRLEYERQQWHMEKNLEEAYQLYLNRVKTYRDITSAEEERIKTYLKSIVSDGLVREKVDTTITTLYWHI